MKRVKLNIFWKTFIITMIMMLFITLIAYTALYILLPGFYKNYKENQYNKLSVQFIERLEKAETELDERRILTDLLGETSASAINVFNEDGAVFFNLSLHYGISSSLSEQDFENGYSHEITQDSNEEKEVVVNISPEDVEILPFAGDARLEYIYFAQGQQRRLQITVALQPLNEAKEVIISIYPIAGLFCVVFSFILASIFSRSFVRPIRRIQKATSKMTLLEPEVVIPVTTEDEIGELSRDINNLYDELRGTIVALEKEKRVYTESENKKIDFLRTVSHELKTPLASANALIEGIIYDVPPYCNDTSKYLGECKLFLDKAIVLTKESLNLSPDYSDKIESHNLSELIANVYPLYRVIAKSKQIEYFVDIPENLFVNTKIKMFSHALSNIFSNAVNYTSTNGRISAKYDERIKALAVENTCIPLTKEELEDALLPFRTGEKRTDMSNGLGLYIIKQILNSLEIKFSFAPNEDGSGMKFTVFVPCDDN